MEEANRDSEGSGIVAGEWLDGLREDGNDRQEQIESRELDRCCWLSTELPVDPRKTSLTFLACDCCM